MKILHVTECYAGGVATVIDAISSALPDYEHHLCWTGAGEKPETRLFQSSVKMPERHLARIKCISDSLDALEPDVIHAHSSWAGLYVRALPKRLPPLIYQPHGFAFSNPALPQATQIVGHCVEYLLSYRSSNMVAVSDWESSITPRKNRTRRSVVPNATPFQEYWPQTQPPHRNNLVITTGRISGQKDPSFFAAVATSVHSSNPSVRIQWAGSGERHLTEILEHSGVEVLGWLPHDKLRSLLTSAELYFHSATMEAGVPLSILEAAAFNLPIVARRIPALRSSGLEQCITVEDCSEAILRALSTPEYRQELKGRSLELHEAHSLEHFRTNWEQVYETAVAEGKVHSW